MITTTRPHMQCFVTTPFIPDFPISRHRCCCGAASTANTMTSRVLYFSSENIPLCLQCIKTQEVEVGTQGQLEDGVHTALELCRLCDPKVSVNSWFQESKRSPSCGVNHQPRLSFTSIPETYSSNATTQDTAADEEREDGAQREALAMTAMVVGPWALEVLIGAVNRVFDIGISLVKAEMSGSLSRSKNEQFSSHSDLLKACLTDRQLAIVSECIVELLPVILRHVVVPHEMVSDPILGALHSLMAGFIHHQNPLKRTIDSQRVYQPQNHLSASLCFVDQFVAHVAITLLNSPLFSIVSLPTAMTKEYIYEFCEHVAFECELLYIIGGTPLECDLYSPDKLTLSLREYSDECLAARVYLINSCLSTVTSQSQNIAAVLHELPVSFARSNRQKLMTREEEIRSIKERLISLLQRNEDFTSRLCTYHLFRTGSSDVEESTKKVNFFHTVLRRTSSTDQYNPQITPHEARQVLRTNFISLLSFLFRFKIEAATPLMLLEENRTSKYQEDSRLHNDPQINSFYDDPDASSNSIMMIPDPPKTHTTAPPSEFSLQSDLIIHNALEGYKKPLLLLLSEPTMIIDGLEGDGLLPSFRGDASGIIHGGPINTLGTASLGLLLTLIDELESENNFTNYSNTDSYGHLICPRLLESLENVSSLSSAWASTYIADMSTTSLQLARWHKSLFLGLAMLLSRAIGKLLMLTAVNDDKENPNPPPISYLSLLELMFKFPAIHSSVDDVVLYFSFLSRGGVDESNFQGNEMWYKFRFVSLLSFFCMEWSGVPSISRLSLLEWCCSHESMSRDPRRNSKLVVKCFEFQEWSFVEYEDQRCCGFFRLDTSVEGKNTVSSIRCFFDYTIFCSIYLLSQNGYFFPTSTEYRGVELYPPVYGGHMSSQSTFHDVRLLLILHLTKLVDSSKKPSFQSPLHNLITSFDNLIRVNSVSDSSIKLSALCFKTLTYFSNIVLQLSKIVPSEAQQLHLQTLTYLLDHHLLPETMPSIAKLVALHIESGHSFQFEAVLEALFSPNGHLTETEGTINLVVDVLMKVLQKSEPGEELHNPIATREILKIMLYGAHSVEELFVNAVRRVHRFDAVVVILQLLKLCANPLSINKMHAVDCSIGELSNSHIVPSIDAVPLEALKLCSASPICFDLLFQLYRVFPTWVSSWSDYTPEELIHVTVPLAQPLSSLGPLSMISDSHLNGNDGDFAKSDDEGIPDDDNTEMNRFGSECQQKLGLVCKFLRHMGRLQNGERVIISFLTSFQRSSGRGGISFSLAIKAVLISVLWPQLEDIEDAIDLYNYYTLTHGGEGNNVIANVLGLVGGENSVEVSLLAELPSNPEFMLELIRGLQPLPGAAADVMGLSFSRAIQGDVDDVVCPMELVLTISEELAYLNAAIQRSYEINTHSILRRSMTRLRILRPLMDNIISANISWVEYFLSDTSEFDILPYSSIFLNFTRILRNSVEFLASQKWDKEMLSEVTSNLNNEKWLTSQLWCTFLKVIAISSRLCETTLKDSNEVNTSRNSDILARFIGATEDILTSFIRLAEYCLEKYPAVFNLFRRDIVSSLLRPWLIGVKKHKARSNISSSLGCQGEIDTDTIYPLCFIFGCPDDNTTNDLVSLILSLQLFCGPSLNFSVVKMWMPQKQIRSIIALAASEFIISHQSNRNVMDSPLSLSPCRLGISEGSKFFSVSPPRTKETTLKSSLFSYHLRYLPMELLLQLIGEDCLGAGGLLATHSSTGSSLNKARTLNGPVKDHLILSFRS